MSKIGIAVAAVVVLAGAGILVGQVSGRQNVSESLLAPREHGLTCAGIVAVVKTQRDSIKSYRFHYQYTRESVGTIQAIPIIPDSKPITFSITEYAVDGDKRRLDEKHRTSQEEPMNGMVTTWNGSFCKEYIPTGKGGVGTIRAAPRHGEFFVPNTPLGNAMLEDTAKTGKPDVVYDLVAFLENDRTIIEPKMALVDNVECIVAKLGGEQVYLDPARGFCVLRRETYNYRATDTLWWRRENSDFKDCGNGIWLPQRTVITDYANKRYAQSDWGKPITVTTYVADIIEVNTKLSDELFDVKYPAGTSVNDETANVRYVVGMENVDKPALNHEPEVSPDLQKETAVPQVKQGVEPGRPRTSSSSCAPGCQ